MYKYKIIIIKKKCFIKFQTTRRYNMYIIIIKIYFLYVCDK